MDERQIDSPLMRILDALDGKTVTIGVEATTAEMDDLVERGRQISLALDAYEARVGRRRT